MIEVADLGVGWGVGTSRNAGIPKGAQANDVLLLCVYSDFVGDDLDVPGFTQIGARVEQLNGTPTQLALFWALHGVAAPVITWDGTSHFCATKMVVLRNCFLDSPVGSVSVEPSATQTNVLRGPSVEIDFDGSMLLMFGYNGPTDLGQKLKTAPPGMDVVYNVDNFVIFEENPMAPGVTGHRDAELVAPEWNIAALVVVVPQQAPVNTDPPDVLGTSKVGQVVEATTGAWGNEPSAFAYRWQIEAGAGWIDIVEADKKTFLITEKERGRKIRCRVTATNTGGPGVAESASVDVPFLWRRQGGGLVAVRRKFKAHGLMIPEPAPLFVGQEVADYDRMEAAPGAITKVPDPAGSGELVFKFTVNDDDVYPVTPTEDPRAQLLSPDIIVEGAEFWLRAAFYLPADFPSGLPPGGWWALMELAYGPPYNEASPMPLTVKGNPGLIGWQRNETHNFDAPWNMPLVKEQWIETLIRGLYSEEGWVEMWVNGGRVTFFDPGHPFVHNPNGIAPTQRLPTATRDKSNFEKPNSSRLASYRKAGMFEEATLYHKPLILRAA